MKEKIQNHSLQEKGNEENNQMQVRKDKLRAHTKLNNGIGFINSFKPNINASRLQEKYHGLDKLTIEGLKDKIIFKVAGRIIFRRNMGKASFFTLQDMSGHIQVYIRKNDLDKKQYDCFNAHWDIGDIVGVKGSVFRTNTGELSIHAINIKLLTKAIRSLPDKFHGLSDREKCYRQRYIDLIINRNTCRVFRVRAEIIKFLRSYFDKRQFIEVETPMMHVIPGGAAAKPFSTYHNALDMPLYLRIAPELYLKRLVIGGFDRVYEINRNFRNEGLSTRHSPEFTMMEFYQAYADYKDLMNLTEDLLRELAKEVLGTLDIVYLGERYDLAKPFVKMTMFDAILHYNSQINKEQLCDFEQALAFAKKIGLDIEENYGLGKIQNKIFEETVEHQLIQPTFITEYPLEVSPLARCNDHNKFVSDRFEFFIGGREIANGFSELNDPEEQAIRFRKQVIEKNNGNDEAMFYDADYIKALEYGLAPTAGEGIGIDRLVMFFTNSPSIRDVILFPHMRPE